MSTAYNPISAAAGAASASGAAATQPKDLSRDPLAQKETFLKLLVAQIRNQNPLNPADGIEFLSQLAQFSQLEQMLVIRSELETIRERLTPAATGVEPNKGA
jgi:flagellar basal-body rod modification protein FlgD